MTPGPRSAFHKHELNKYFEGDRKADPWDLKATRCDFLGQAEVSPCQPAFLSITGFHMGLAGVFQVTEASLLHFKKGTLRPGGELGSE